MVTYDEGKLLAGFDETLYETVATLEMVT